MVAWHENGGRSASVPPTHTPLIHAHAIAGMCGRANGMWFWPWRMSCTYLKALIFAAYPVLENTCIALLVSFLASPFPFISSLIPVSTTPHPTLWFSKVMDIYQLFRDYGIVSGHRKSWQAYIYEMIRVKMRPNPLASNLAKRGIDTSA